MSLHLSPSSWCFSSYSIMFKTSLL